MHVSPTSFPACKHRKTRRTATGTLRWLASEPFRLFFASGMVWSIIGVSLWPLFYAGRLGFFPNLVHSRLMIEAFGAAFVVGFPGTASPPSFRLAGLLLYQGLLLPPVLGIGSFLFPRILGGEFGEPSTAAGRTRSLAEQRPSTLLCRPLPRKLRAPASYGHSNMKRLLTATLAATFLCSSFAFAEAPASQLPPNARVAIIGDSITEQKLYSKFIETYLLACTGRKDIKCFQFGWGGETAGGFKLREENDLGAFHPTVATFCYGMNDGRYVPYADAIGKDYEANMRAVLTKAKEIGVTNIVAGTPGAVDTKYFVRPGGTTPDQYNDNLAQLGEIDRKLAAEFHTAFADVHHEMTDAMTKAKAALGADYDVCGRDGVHPAPNGHLLMAAAFLKGLGLDGNIGDITVDMNGASTASEGHAASGSNGTAEVVSNKWPFCFEADPKAPSTTRSILPFCKFNEELNRLTLRVKNLDAPKAKVTWGKASKEFTKEQLTAGINLAAEFLDSPFHEAFASVINAVAAKQGFETSMIKSLITNFRSFADDANTDAEFAAALGTLKKKLLSKQEKLDAATRALIVPVKHTITVEAVN
jgi:lysophospholipase L1-like esterase